MAWYYTQYAHWQARYSKPTVVPRLASKTLHRHERTATRATRVSAPLHALPVSASIEAKGERSVHSPRTDLIIEEAEVRRWLLCAGPHGRFARERNISARRPAPPLRGPEERQVAPPSPPRRQKFEGYGHHKGTRVPTYPGKWKGSMLWYARQDSPCFHLDPPPEANHRFPRRSQVAGTT